MVEPEASRTLEDCLARIRQLEEENAHLREAAKTFGELAERLKRALDAELRRAGQSGPAGIGLFHWTFSMPVRLGWLNNPQPATLEIHHVFAGRFWEGI